MSSITVTFTSDNEIKSIDAEEGVVPEELLALAKGINADPVWLLSPADRQSEAGTSVTVEREDLRSIDIHEIRTTSPSIDDNGNVETTGEEDTLFLDEKDEVYGYGVFNTHRNCLVPPIGSDSNVLGSEQDAIEHFENIDEPDKAHLRIVRITLDNKTDKKAVGMEVEN